MTRRPTTWLLAGLAAVTAAGAGAAAVVHPLAVRAFTVAADAYPVSPAFGTHHEPIGVVLFESRAEVSNPPLASAARSAATDLGMIEAYTGPEGPQAVASTQSAGLPTDARTDWHGAVFTAHADSTPRAAASATGQQLAPGQYSIGAIRSAASADGSGPRLQARIDTELHDVRVGALTLTTASLVETVSTSGRPGGARASGHITVTGASLAGVPVSITARGLSLQAGYGAVRLVQPRTFAAKNGSAASVSGGGVEFLVSSNNATNDYFVTLNLLAGSATVALGGTLSPPVTSGLPVVSGPAVPAAAPPPGRPALLAHRGYLVTRGRLGRLAIRTSSSALRSPLPTIWPGWPVLLAALAGGFVVAAFFRRRVRAGYEAIADRYLRG